MWRIYRLRAAARAWHICHVTPFAEIVEAHLRKTGGSAIGLALRAGLNRDAIRSVLRGRAPSVDRAREICDALGLDLRIVPKRDPLPLEYETVVRAMDLFRDAEGSLETLRSRAADYAKYYESLGTDRIMQELQAEDDAGRADLEPVGIDAPPPASRPVGVMELAAAAGAGAEAGSERARWLAWFPRKWLDERGLDPTRCAVIRVRGDSMEPTLPDGCAILFDRNRRDRHERRLYVVRTGSGLIVKRAARRRRMWVLASDNPAFAPEPWPPEAETIGEVAWMARALIEPLAPETA